MVEVLPTDWLRWIVLLPLLSAAVQGVGIGLLRAPLSRRVSAAVSCASLGLAFVVGFAALLQLVGEVSADSPAVVLIDDIFTWIGAGRLQIEAALAFDPMAAVLVLLITGVGLLVHLHAISVSWHDDREDAGFQRFFCFLDLSAASMLLLVLAENLALFFVGWQLVGLCMHLLVGFWYLDSDTSRGATRLFAVQLLGDVALLLAILLLFQASVEPEHVRLDFRSLAGAIGALGQQTLGTPVFWSALPGMPALGIEWSVSSLLAFGVVVAAACRAAQLPLQFWARDLGSTPLPGLALLLGTLGLSSGVVLLLKVPALLEADQGLSLALAWTGALTALLAAAAAGFQRDIRHALVLISLVQLGLMFLAIGLGAHAAALFHLVTHAVFIATLLVCCSSLGRELGVAADQPLLREQLGGLWRRLPRTHLAFLCGGAAAVGLPFTAGFFSRDQILLAAGLAEVPGRLGLQLTALLATAVTAWVVTKLWADIFHGESRLPRGRLESIQQQVGPRGGPLLLLAFLSLFIGWLGPSAALNPFPVPGDESNSLANFVAPFVPGLGFDVSNGTERRLALVAVGITLVFVGLAWRFRRRAAGDGPLPAGLHRGLLPLAPAFERGLFDTTYLMAALVRPALRLSDRVLMRGLEARLAASQALGGPARSLRQGIDLVRRPLQSGSPQGYVFFMLVGALAMLIWLLP